MANSAGTFQGKEPGSPHPGQTLQRPGELPEDESVAGVIDDDRDAGSSDSDIISERRPPDASEAGDTAGGL